MHARPASASQRRDNQATLQRSVGSRGEAEQSLHYHRLSLRTETKTHLCLHKHILYSEMRRRRDEDREEPSKNEAHLYIGKPRRGDQENRNRGRTWLEKKKLERKQLGRRRRRDVKPIAATPTSVNRIFTYSHFPPPLCQRSSLTLKRLFSFLLRKYVKAKYEARAR